MLAWKFRRDTPFFGVAIRICFHYISLYQLFICNKLTFYLLFLVHKSVFLPHKSRFIGHKSRFFPDKINLFARKSNYLGIKSRSLGKNHHLLVKRSRFLTIKSCFLVQKSFFMAINNNFFPRISRLWQENLISWTNYSLFSPKKTTKRR